MILAQNPLVFCRVAGAKVTFETAQQQYHSKGENPLPEIPEGSIADLGNFYSSSYVDDARVLNACECDICEHRCAVHWDLQYSA